PHRAVCLRSGVLRLPGSEDRPGRPPRDGPVRDPGRRRLDHPGGGARLYELPGRRPDPGPRRRLGEGFDRFSPPVPHPPDPLPPPPSPPSAPLSSSWPPPPWPSSPPCPSGPPSPPRGARLSAPTPSISGSSSWPTWNWDTCPRRWG